jgi:hypothetical protein
VQLADIRAPLLPVAVELLDVLAAVLQIAAQLAAILVEGLASGLDGRGVARLVGVAELLSRGLEILAVLPDLLRVLGDLPLVAADLACVLPQLPAVALHVLARSGEGGESDHDDGRACGAGGPVDQGSHGLSS